MNSVQRDPVVGVLVTHNSQQFLAELLDSIDSQTQPLDQLIVIDDNSTDSTRSILSERGITAIASTSAATDLSTRIASNFLQGVRCAPLESIVILGDHDDTWLPNRVEHQSHMMASFPQAAMLASDGYTTNSTNPTLRSTFPVPGHWSDLTTRAQFTYAVKHSIATGGASAVRPSRLPATIPTGWLHDRWWSLAAVSKKAMVLDSVLVINYRISPSQQVGLDTQAQHQGTKDWVCHHVGNAGRSIKRSADLVFLLTGRLNK
jgi:glycosyltransferase involved in cell wall biosynthesis